MEYHDPVHGPILDKDIEDGKILRKLGVLLKKVDRLRAELAEAKKEVGQGKHDLMVMRGDRDAANSRERAANKGWSKTQLELQKLKYTILQRREGKS